MTTATGFRPLERRSGGETRVAILAVATQEFRDHGYTAATLSDVAAQLGLTRTGVLHHFGTKADILRAVTEPWLTALAGLLAPYPASTPMTRPGARLFVGDLYDLMVVHRDVILLLAHDRAGTDPVSGAAVAGLTTHVIAVLTGGRDDTSTRIRAAAALGALENTVVWHGNTFDLTEPIPRAIAIDTVLRLSPARPPSPAAPGRVVVTDAAGGTNTARPGRSVSQRSTSRVHAPERHLGIPGGKARTAQSR